MPFIIVTVIVILDQLTKYLVTQRLALHESLPLIKGIFHLTLVYNTGAAFGVLRNQLPFFIATAFVCIFFIAFNLRAHADRKSRTVSLSLILAGAVGNLIDRLLHGHVIDFLDFRIWPVFNLADSAITVGAVVLAVTIIRDKNVS